MLPISIRFAMSNFHSKDAFRINDVQESLCGLKSSKWPHQTLKHHFAENFAHKSAMNGKKFRSIEKKKKKNKEKFLCLIIIRDL